MMSSVLLLAATVAGFPEPVNLFARDAQRSFTAVQQPTDFVLTEKDGKTVLGYEVDTVDLQFLRDHAYAAMADYDIISDGVAVHGDDVMMAKLAKIADEEGFGPDHHDNWLRIQGRNDTGTTNLDYPVLVEPRLLMVCALICDFCETVPVIHAFRLRDRNGVDRDRAGFNFLIGVGASKRGIPTVLKIHNRLLENDDYCSAFADLVNEACVRTNGEFTASAINRRIDRRIAELRKVAGDKVDVTKEVAEFEALRARMLARLGKYISTFDLADLLATAAPLAVNEKGEALPAYGRYRGKIELRHGATKGKIYYSDIGCDPRDDDGEVSPMVNEYTGPFDVQGRCQLRARVRTEDGKWSPLEMVNLNLE